MLHLATLRQSAMMLNTQHKMSCFIICALQARAVGDELVVGLVPDSEILRCKGPPVQNEQERKIMVEAVKWVGEVITGEQCALLCSSAGRMKSSVTNSPLHMRWLDWSTCWLPWAVMPLVCTYESSTNDFGQ